MSFAEVQFPADIAYGSAGGPEYSTDIVVTHGGYEQRNSNWSQARSRYNVASGVKTASQLESLIAFFRARQGQAQGFRFKDWTDYQGIAQTLGTGDGSATSFQLVKRYSSGATTVSRTITKPVTVSVKIYVDASLQSSGYSLDSTSGVVTFDSPPSNGDVISADFEFDVPVRFATDRLSARLQDYGVYSTLDIPLIEVRT
jgi:uncharacterized protein (TIGR02217 family)